MGSVEGYLRGVAWPAGGGAHYPRADPADAVRLPADTWAAATIPAGVRLELVGDATHVEVDYVTETDDLGLRGAGAGRSFALWRGGEPVDEQPAVLGPGRVRLSMGDGDGRAVVHLPEGMRPSITGVAGVGGAIGPAPAQPRWLAYGDSITEGWSATAPALTWPAVAGRATGFDVVNLGYAGAARGELASAEQLAALDADVVSVAFGTNCWTRVPHSVAMMGAVTDAFLRIVRAGLPAVPIVVVSPVVRPDAEVAPNRLGATLAQLRRAMEDATQALGDDDDLVTLVPGGDILAPAHLADGVHPGDEGHRVLAGVVGNAVRAACSRVP